MVQRERSEPGGDPQQPAEMAPTEARRRAARKLFTHEERMQAKRDEVLVRPGFRERVEELMRAEWREPVIVLRLGDTDFGFDVPGRRLDGTVRGKRLVRRFFWNVLRGIGGAVLYVVYLANGGGEVGNPFHREIRVTGPANAMALDLLDELRRTRGPWLVCSPTRIAVVDTGPTYVDPADAPPPRIVWQTSEPKAPEISFGKRTMKWPDGSSFKFLLQGRTEQEHLRKYHEPPNTTHWHGRPAQQPEDT
ncbi:hypothetical protein [Saccharopolyspora sp. NPDC050642]|uniref:hypothetical protein n=1 Tax=Saccharopolyspora sp. NPDC050642 TaxID=3157099 RepID=UPI0033F6C0CB